MTATFADFVAEQDARDTIEQNVTKWTLMLCDALRDDYIKHSMASHKFAISKNDHNTYHQECIEKLKNGESDYEFTIESGRKYHKIIMNARGSRSVHAFVDRKTGSVYKSSSWRSPAKGERYNLLLIKDREWLLKTADWAGSYLYRR